MPDSIKRCVTVLLSWRFLLNLLVILVVTCWVPLLSETVVMTDSDGNVIQEVVTTSRLYESWWIVARRGTAAGGHLKAFALHLGLCFSISFSVWFIAATAQQRAKDDQPDTENQDDQ